MKKINFSYYLFLLLLAPLVYRLLTILNSYKLDFQLPVLRESLLVLVLAVLLTFALTRFTGPAWELSLAALWAIGQQRILELGQVPVTSAWKSFAGGQGVHYFTSLAIGPNLLALFVYLLLLIASIKIARLKGGVVLPFVLWSLVVFQLGFRLISYRF